MALTWLSSGSGGVLLRVRVQPRASRTEVSGVHGDALKIRVAAPPVDGAANRALVTFLAKRLGVPKASVVLRSGHGGRLKSVWLEGIGEAAVRGTLADDV